MATDIPLVTVSANAITTVPATLADLTFTVHHEALTANEAQTAVSETSNALLLVLRGLPEVSRISTENVSLEPRYDDDQQVTGYRSVIEVSLRTPLPNTGEIIASVTQEKIGSASVLISDFSRTAEDEVQQQAYEQALTVAMTTAHRKAAIAANALGLQLRAIHRIDIGDVGSRYQSESMNVGAAMMAAPRSILQIEGGDLDVKASVSLQITLATSDLKNSSSLTNPSRFRTPTTDRQ